MWTTALYEPKPFSQFLRDLRWKQGEHMLIAAPTQAGKSTLASYLVARRGQVVVLAAKGKEDNLRRRYADFAKITDWPPPRDKSKVLLWPTRQATAALTMKTQQDAFKKCLDYVNMRGAWCVVDDESHWMSQFLRLDKEIAILHHQGSSQGVTMVNLTQRPSWIPKIIYSSSSHVFIGNTSDRDDLKSLSNLGGVDAKEVAETVQRIGRHDLLYINSMGDGKPCVINVRK